MNDTKNTIVNQPKGEDWAIIPFDEAADNERWAALAAEMDALEESARGTEALIGSISMQKELPGASDEVGATNFEDGLYDPLDPF